MTLLREIILIVVAAILTIFISTFLITAQQTRNYFEEQLNHNSKDTATSLGLSLSEQAGKKLDSGIISSKIDAIFDSGYFSNIWVKDMEGKILISRNLKHRYQSVPYWFIKLVKIENTKKSALIMRGWQQFGEVVVQSDSTLAYAALWKTITQLFILFLLVSTFIISISVLLIKNTFHPLNCIIKQAQDIGRKHFYTLNIHSKIKEVTQLSTAINTMVNKLQRFFITQIKETEELRAKVYKDSLTNLGNRRYFFQQLNQYLSNEEEFAPGYLFLVNISGLISFNDHYGYQEGDRVITLFSQKITEIMANKNLFLLARLDGPDFAMVFFEHDRDLIEAIVDILYQQLDKLLKARDKSLACIIGVVKCLFSETSSSLLSRADNAIQKAQHQTTSQYFIETHEDNHLQELSNSQWQSIITQAISNKSFTFYYQPVFSCEGTYHKECFVKLINGSKEIAAREFFSIAEEYSLGYDIDKLILQELASYSGEEMIAMNLSISTVIDHTDLFLNLVKEYSKHKKLKLQFEISEFLLYQDTKTVKSFIVELAKLGYSVGLDRVASTFAPFEQLKKLTIAYLKLDASFSHNLSENKSKTDLISKLVLTTNCLDITLIATAIESESQYNCLKQLGITHFQGNYLCSPSKSKK